MAPAFMQPTFHPGAQPVVQGVAVQQHQQPAAVAAVAAAAAQPAHVGQLAVQPAQPARAATRRRARPPAGFPTAVPQQWQLLTCSNPTTRIERQWPAWPQNQWNQGSRWFMGQHTGEVVRGTREKLPGCQLCEKSGAARRKAPKSVPGHQRAVKDGQGPCKRAGHPISSVTRKTALYTPAAVLRLFEVASAPGMVPDPEVWEEMQYTAVERHSNLRQQLRDQSREQQDESSLYRRWDGRGIYWETPPQPVNRAALQPPPPGPVAPFLLVGSAATTGPCQPAGGPVQPPGGPLQLSPLGPEHLPAALRQLPAIASQQLPAGQQQPGPLQLPPAASQHLAVWPQQPPPAATQQLPAEPLQLPPPTAPEQLPPQPAAASGLHSLLIPCPACQPQIDVLVDLLAAHALGMLHPVPPAVAAQAMQLDSRLAAVAAQQLGLPQPQPAAAVAAQLLAWTQQRPEAAAAATAAASQALALLQQQPLDVTGLPGPHQLAAATAFTTLATRPASPPFPGPLSSDSVGLLVATGNVQEFRRILPLLCHQAVLKQLQKDDRYGRPFVQRLLTPTRQWSRGYYDDCLPDDEAGAAQLEMQKAFFLEMGNELGAILTMPNGVSGASALHEAVRFASAHPAGLAMLELVARHCEMDALLALSNGDYLAMTNALRCVNEPAAMFILDRFLELLALARMDPRYAQVMFFERGSFFQQGGGKEMMRKVTAAWKGVPLVPLPPDGNKGRRHAADSQVFLHRYLWQRYRIQQATVSEEP